MSTPGRARVRPQGLSASRRGFGRWWVTGLLLPLLVLTGSMQASGATQPPPEPGFTLERVERVVKYRFDGMGGDGFLDSGTVRVAYTCRPGGGWTDGVFVTIDIQTATAWFSAGRDGELVPCDGRRHRVDLPVNRGTTAPFTPPAKVVAGQAWVSAEPQFSPFASFRSDVVTLRMRFLGDWPVGPWSD